MMTYGYGNNWYARGHVSIISPNKSVIEIKRFEPREVFPSKEEAEAHEIKLAKAWVDEHG